MTGPPAAAASLARSPGRAVLAAVAIALGTVWAALAASYEISWPVGFFVGTLSALCYGLGRGAAAWRRTRGHRRAAVPVPPPAARGCGPVPR
jgi:ABC-type Mn2+/Zn2+ transport system permease subunit